MKKLFLSSCILALLSIPTISKAQVFFPDSDEIPEGDCLEMICEYGCVEDAQKNGSCCPAPIKGQNCLLNKYDTNGCLIEETTECEYGCVATPDGLGRCCPAPQEGESCNTDEKDEYGCIIKTKKKCPNGQSCQSNGVCATNMCPENQTPVGEKCCLNTRIYRDSNNVNQCCEKDLVTLNDGTSVCQTDEEICQPLHITTSLIKTLPETQIQRPLVYIKSNGRIDHYDYTKSDWEYETMPIYKISYQGTITPKRDIELDYGILGIIDTSNQLYNLPRTKQKLIIKRITPGKNKTLVNSPLYTQTKLKYKWNGSTKETTLKRTYLKAADAKITLEAGETYEIDIDLRNVCEACLIDTECAF